MSIVCLGIFSNSIAQTTQLGLSKGLLQIVLFEKKAFYESNSITKALLMDSVSEMYAYTGDFKNAYRVQSSIPVYFLDAEMIKHIELKNIFYAYLSNNHLESIAHCSRLESLDSTSTIQTSWMKALNYNALGMWDSSKVNLLKWAQKNSQDSLHLQKASQEINELYKKAPKMHSKEISSKWAFYFPGGSYLYNKQYKDWVVNVGFQTLGIGIMGVYAFYFQQYATALVVGYGFFQRFYQGAIKKSDYLVDKYNHHKSLRFDSEYKSWAKKQMATK